MSGEKQGLVHKRVPMWTCVSWAARYSCVWISQSCHDNNQWRFHINRHVLLAHLLAEMNCRHWSSLLRKLHEYRHACGIIFCSEFYWLGAGIAYGVHRSVRDEIPTNLEETCHFWNKIWGSNAQNWAFGNNSLSTWVKVLNFWYKYISLV